MKRPRRLLSRKLWMGLFGAVSPYVARLATKELSVGTAVTLSVLSVISYVLAEGATDVAGMRTNNDRPNSEGGNDADNP